MILATAMAGSLHAPALQGEHLRPLTAHITGANLESGAPCGHDQSTRTPPRALLFTIDARGNNRLPSLETDCPEFRSRPSVSM
jgi:hypothetical protein